ELLSLADPEQTGVLEKERTFFGEADVESRQVDLLRVDFHLSEVGVVCRVEIQAGRDAELRVEAPVTVRVDRSRLWQIGPIRRSDDVREHLEVARGVQLQAMYFTGRRKTAQVVLPRKRGPEALFALPLDVAREVDAPDLWGRPVAQCAQRDAEFRHP